VLLVNPGLVLGAGHLALGLAKSAFFARIINFVGIKLHSVKLVHEPDNHFRFSLGGLAMNKDVA